MGRDRRQRNGPPSGQSSRRCFPDPFNADTWNMAAISPLGADLRHRRRRLRHPRCPAAVSARWLQDDWQISLEPDAEPRAALRPEHQRAAATSTPCRRSSKRDAPTTPTTCSRASGFAYQLNDRDRRARRHRAVLLGRRCRSRPSGWRRSTGWRVIQVTNDGRPNFAADPLQRPAAADAGAGAAAVLPRQQRARLPPPLDPGADGARRNSPRDLARTWQTSIGVQRQLGATMAVEADYVYSQGRHEKDVIDNVNLTLQPGDRRELSVLGHQPAARIPTTG